METTQEFTAVGKRVPKVDAVDKATGRAQYIQDVKLPGMLYGKILYSKYPHARIVKIDTEKAKSLPGVRVILTGEDIPPVRMGVYKDNPPLKSWKVRSYRDEVAAVAATDPETAKKAINKNTIIFPGREEICEDMLSFRRRCTGTARGG